MQTVRRPRPFTSSLRAPLAALAVTVAALGPAACAPAAPSTRATPAAAPSIADSTFWRMVTDFSEPGGFFRSDNFVSNEVTVQHVIPDLVRDAPQGGVYLGVGPDQNFTDLVALKPRIAFIVDIRRQNMIQHLMYKTLFELSPDRADFLAQLFSRPRPEGLESAGAPEALFAVYDRVQPDSMMYVRTLATIRERLAGHGFTLGEEDQRTLEYVFYAFYTAGPDLTYNFAPGPFRNLGPRRMPTYGELMVETDSAGVQRSYLASEAHYGALREMQRNNLIVPLVGDFAGDKALRAVGDYLRGRQATVTAFYLSNVEQYLYRQDDDWRRFLLNVSALPVDSTSVFLRSVFNGSGIVLGPTGPRSVTLRASIPETLKAFDQGKIATYYDVIGIVKP